jgi:hypothetical protein
VALAGMKTACGAVLIATQILDTVELGNGLGAHNGGEKSTLAARGSGQEQFARQQSTEASSATGTASSQTEEEHFYTLVDATGNPAEEYRYDLHCDGTLHTKGGSYVRGVTVSAKAASGSRLVSWLESDGGLES